MCAHIACLSTPPLKRTAARVSYSRSTGCYVIPQLVPWKSTTYSWKSTTCSAEVHRLVPRKSTNLFRPQLGQSSLRRAARSRALPAASQLKRPRALVGGTLHQGGESGAPGTLSQEGARADVLVLCPVSLAGVPCAPCPQPMKGLCSPLLSSPLLSSPPCPVLLRSALALPDLLSMRPTPHRRRHAAAPRACLEVATRFTSAPLSQSVRHRRAGEWVDNWGSGGGGWPLLVRRLCLVRVRSLQEGS